VSTLYVFAISHFCERARFGLDLLGLPYGLVHWPPGAHLQRSQELGAPGSSLPILQTGAQVIQGSSEILDWAERESGEANTLAPSGNDDVRAMERRLDEVAGVHTRRAFYSEALIEHPETVLPIFVRDLTPEEREATTGAWSFLCEMMRGRMDLGPEQERESVRLLEGELDWLDGLLADGRGYLVGDRLSRVDLSAASLLAPLVDPPEHPNAGAVTLAPRMRENVDGWRDRPVMRWVAEIYRRHR